MKQSLSETIASEFEQRIQSNFWKEHEKLSSERNLAEEFNVSRAVIREALKILREKGLIINQPGKGNFVCHSQAESINSRFEAFMDSNSISVYDMIDAREELESIIGARAIQYVTCRHLKEIDALYHKMEDALSDIDAFHDYDYQFHLKLAECSGNATLRLLFSSLYSITGKNIFASVTESEKIRKHAQVEHYHIVCALKTRSPRNMKRAIHNHMNCIRDHIMQQK